MSGLTDTFLGIPLRPRQPVVVLAAVLHRRYGCREACRPLGPDPHFPSASYNEDAAALLADLREHGVVMFESREALIRDAAEALHGTGLNNIGHKAGSHGRFTERCICNADAAELVARLLGPER